MLSLDRGVTHPIRVLFLCTGNSARSQIAEALLQRDGAGRYVAGSAGSHPVERVNPHAIEVLRDAGIDWSGRSPKAIDDVAGEPWDIVITVCDNAREACPLFPEGTIMGHWGLPDPAEVTGDDNTKRHAFAAAFAAIARRVDMLLALPLDTLDREAVAARLTAIGAV